MHHGFPCYKAGQTKTSITFREGDLFLYFDGGIYLDGYLQNADDKDVFGINHGLLTEATITPADARPTFDEDSPLPSILLSSGVALSECNKVKVYRRNRSGQWHSLLQDSDEPWKGWFKPDIFAFDAQAGEVVVTEELRDSSEMFVTQSFKPQYSRFVKRLRSRNRRFREHLGRDGQEFQLSNIYENVDVDTLIDIAIFIGGPNEFEEDEKRNMSVLYHFVRGVCGTLVKTASTASINN